MQSSKNRRHFKKCCEEILKYMCDYKSISFEYKKECDSCLDSFKGNIYGWSDFQHNNEAICCGSYNLKLHMLSTKVEF